MWGFALFSVIFIIIMVRLAWIVTRPEESIDENYEYTHFDEDESEDSEER